MHHQSSKASRKAKTTLKAATSDLDELNKLRQQNSRSATERAQHEHQKKLADSQAPEVQQAWFGSMKKVLEEVDEELRCIPPTASLHFLDLGCCPGGFSSYILSKNPQATGVGISLPVESGGHAFLMEEDLRTRFQLNLTDLTDFQLGPYSILDPRLRFLPFPANGRSFDLVLLDGHPLRSKSPTRGLGDRLLISQLIISLQALSISGTLIMKLAKPERVVTSQIMYLLDMLSLESRTWKPICIHATRDTFYIVAKGFGLGRHGSLLANYIEGLRVLWAKLRNGDHKRVLSDSDLDFIANDHLLRSAYQERLLQLSQHIWQVQSLSLQGKKEAQAKGF